MSNDPFEQEFQRWLHGVQYEAEMLRRAASMSMLISDLRKHGHRVDLDWHRRHILVDENWTITMHVAREERPETILRWIEDERV